MGDEEHTEGAEQDGADTGDGGEALEFRCANCGARMEWDPDEAALVCGYCDGRTPVEQGERSIAVYSLEGADAAERGLGLATRTAVCKNCGARVAFGEREVAQDCLFCGESGVLEEDAHRNAVRPGSIVPLRVGQDRVQAAFRKWLKRRWFAPGAVRRLADFDAVGVYIPFWAFDCQASSDWTADAGYYYYVNKKVWVTRGGERVRVNRRERKIRWESASGDRHDVFSDVMVLGSRGIDGKLAKRVGKYELSGLVNYSPAYLSGWAAEEYQVPLDSAWEGAETRVRATQRFRCSGDVPGDTQRSLRVHTIVGDVHWKLVLLPLWSLAYKWKGKTYPVLLNGQTGQVAGRAPTSWVKILLIVLLAAAIVTTVVLLSN